jgi:tetratricopeptide (TPR) repeat protein
MIRRWLLLLIAVLSCVFVALRGAPSLLGNVAALVMQKTWQNLFAAIPMPACQPRASYASLIDLLQWAKQVESAPAMLGVIQARLMYLQGDCAGASEAIQTVLAQDSITAITAGALVYVGSPLAAPVALQRNLSLYSEAQGLRAELAHNYAAAEDWYRWSVQLSPHLSVVNRLTSIYANANRTAEVLSAWQALSDAAPRGSADYWGATAGLAELHADYAQAVQAYHELLKLSPADYSIWMQMGNDYQNMKYNTSAQDAFMQALRLRPDKVQPYLALGRLALNALNWQTASDWFNRADQAAPTYAEPRIYLGWLHCRQADFTSAAADFDIAQKRKANSAILYYYIAQCLYLQKELDQAATAMQHAIQLDGIDRIFPWYMSLQLGDWLALQNKWSQARDAYQQALAWHPGDTLIRQRLERLQGQNGN